MSKQGADLSLTIQSIKTISKLIQLISLYLDNTIIFIIFSCIPSSSWFKLVSRRAI